MAIGVGIFKAASPDIIGIGVDLRLSEIHKAESTVTDQPIEDGSIVSDHIILQPETVEILAEMSNFDGNDSQSVGERASTAWQDFKTQLKSRQLFDLVTYHELYEDMALVSLSGEHVSPYTGRMQLTLSFKKVDSTQLGFVAVPESILAGDVAKTASSEIEGGPQVPVTEENNSALFANIRSVQQTNINNGSTQL